MTRGVVPDGGDSRRAGIVLSIGRLASSRPSGARAGIVLRNGRFFRTTIPAPRGFTERFNVDRLVWFEAHENAEAAITRDKQIERWRRAWKIELIESHNPEWRDLYETIASF